MKAGGYDVKIEPLIEYINKFGDPTEISKKIEDFVDNLLPYSSEAFTTGNADGLLDSLCYVNELKLMFRHMKVNWK